MLRTTGSGWSGFVRDELTTLPETDDRILATAVSARWTYAEGGIDYSAAWHAARDAILEAFGDHYSPSVQFTLRRMGRAVLKAVDAIDRVHLSLPNRHHLLYDLSRFGLENPNVDLPRDDRALRPDRGHGRARAVRARPSGLTLS